MTVSMGATLKATLVLTPWNTSVLIG